MLTFEQEIYTWQIDFSRHVSNIVYVQWLEMGRLKLLEAVGYPVPRMAELGFLPVLTETEIQYRRALYIGDIVRVSVWITQIRNASVSLEFRVENHRSEVAATARQRGTFISAETLRPLRLTPEMRAALEPYLLSPEA